MNLRITYIFGRTEDYNEVRYTSIYPNNFDGGPKLMKIEFINSAYPSMTIDLGTVKNITLISKD